MTPEDAVKIKKKPTDRFCENIYNKTNKVNVLFKLKKIIRILTLPCGI